MKLNISPATRATLKGFATAVFAAIVSVVAPAIQSGNFVFDWTTIWHTAVAAAIGYIGQKIISPAPTAIKIDPSKTSVIDKTTKEVIVNSGK